MTKDTKNICIITVPISKSGITPLKNLLKIMKNFSRQVYVITGNEGMVYCLEHGIPSCGLKQFSTKNFLYSIINYISLHLEISYKIIRLKNVDDFVFFFGGESLFLPVLVAKILKKTSTVILTGFPTKCSQKNKNKMFQIRNQISKFVFRLCDKIVVYSPNITKERELEKYHNKIFIAKHHFMNFKQFKIKMDYDKRKNCIGFVGELRDIKGITKLIRAMPEILKILDMNLFVIGDGNLKEEIKKFLKNRNLEKNVQLMGWVENKDLPDYLNEFKLLVLPSFTEGLPNIIVESMSCGTPVLASTVGAIPDIIIDGENGFLIEDISEKNIAKKIVNIFETENLSKISSEAHAKAIQDFDFEKILKLWIPIFSKKLD